MEQTLLRVLNSLALFNWLSFTSFVFIGAIAQLYQVKQSPHKTKRHEFVVVSIAKRSVRNSLMECVDHLITHFGRCPYILVDEGAELIPALLLKFQYDRVIVVPKNYRTDLKAKGRAINYFIQNVVKDEYWYSFVDDDNLVMDDTFLYEIPYYEAKGYVATNPILKPREGKSTIAYIMDWMRYFDDVTVFRFFIGLLKRPYIGVHGELLTVKGKILKEVGFDFQSITEDFRFSTELVRKDYLMWQSSTVVSIKSPNSISDLLKQRGRWFKGLLLDLPQSSLVVQLLVGWRLALWVLGIFGSWALCWLWFMFDNDFILLTIPGGAYYLFVYVFGVWKTKRYRYFMLIPALGIIEATSFLPALRQKGFVVINKN